MIAPFIVVPDASVILKWVLPSADESGLEQALSLRDAITGGNVQAVVPRLWLFEVGNTLARRLPERAADMLDALLRFGFVAAVESPAWMREACGLTRRYGVTLPPFWMREACGLTRRYGVTPLTMPTRS